MNLQNLMDLLNLMNPMNLMNLINLMNLVSQNKEKMAVALAPQIVQKLTQNEVQGGEC